jgi:2-keto-4-pentenoate hydratase/2-oxohepta-3-ene-1,7-dioic acid hydratase in catechol pathway
VISNDCRDVPEERARDFILGYTIGNDLTARKYQNPERGGGQFTRAKAYDGFAPIGPVLVSADAFGDLADRALKTTVNGREVQHSKLDLIHGPEKLVSFLSQGKTSCVRYHITDTSSLQGRHCAQGRLS